MKNIPCKYNKITPFFLKFSHCADSKGCTDTEGLD